MSEETKIANAHEDVKPQCGDDGNEARGCVDKVWYLGTKRVRYVGRTVSGRPLIEIEGGYPLTVTNWYNVPREYWPEGVTPRTICGVPEYDEGLIVEFS